MIQFIIGAAAGAAGMWAYQKWFGEPDDDDWDTGVWDQPTTTSYPSATTATESPSTSPSTTPSAPTSATSSPSATTSPSTSSSGVSSGGSSPSSPAGSPKS